MFLDSLDTRLFRPLASPNARVYGIGLWALYSRLVLGQLDGDECTPKEARDIIRRELIVQNQPVDWCEEDEGKEAGDGTENDDAFRIYSYLRECGWLMEMDDIGYRRITYFPQIASRLLSALSAISGNRTATLGATCQGVYTALLAAHDKPKENASQIEFAAQASRDFYAELSNIAASCREIAHRMSEVKAGPALFHVFFKDFMQDLVLGDYTSIKTQSHPYRYRLSTLAVVTDIVRSDSVMDALTEAVARSDQNANRDEVHKDVTKNLDDIYRIFEGIDGLMDRIERYRSAMTRRTREAMQYVYRAIPDIGKKLGELVRTLSSVEDVEEIHVPAAPLINDTYLAPQRCYTPKAKPIEPEPTVIKKPAPPVRDIAFSRAYDVYLQRRIENPDRIIDLVEKSMGNKSTITTCDIEVQNLDDFIAFMQLRDLLHDAVVPDSPYRPLLRHYRVSPIPNKMTENEFLSAPALRIDRRGIPPRRKPSDAA